MLRWLLGQQGRILACNSRFSVLLVSKIRFARLQLVDECALSLCLRQADWTERFERAGREGISTRESLTHTIPTRTYVPLSKSRYLFLGERACGPTTSSVSPHLVNSAAQSRSEKIGITIRRYHLLYATR